MNYDLNGILFMVVVFCVTTPHLPSSPSLDVVRAEKSFIFIQLRCLWQMFVLFFCAINDALCELCRVLIAQQPLSGCDDLALKITSISNLAMCGKLGQIK